MNHWDSPSTMISFEDSSLRGGLQLKQIIWSALQPVIEEWVGRPVEPTSLYGIRVYKNKAILATRKSSQYNHVIVARCSSQAFLLRHSPSLGRQMSIDCR